MVINTKTKEVNVSSIISTTINRNGKSYPALKFVFPGEITADDITGLTSGVITIGENEHEGYNTLDEISVVVGKITTAEAERDAMQEERDAIRAEHTETMENVKLILPILDDETALAVKSLFPEFGDIIGHTVKAGFRFTYGDKLYKTVQPETTIQAHYTPGTGAESLYEEICESHPGTADDPIPYDGNMALTAGLYYVQDGVTYLCTRDTVNPVYNALADLVGLYVEAAA